MTKKYCLEIYEPGSIDDVVSVLESEGPFMTLNKGDILNPRTLPNAESRGGLFRVVALEHFIWETAGTVKHKIGVITEEVEDTKAARFSSA